MTLDKDKAATSRDASSIGAYVSGATKTNVTSTQCVQDILAAPPVDSPIWDPTNSCDILIDIVNSAEAMVGTYVADQEYYNQKDQQYRFCNSNAGLE